MKKTEFDIELGEGFKIASYPAKSPEEAVKKYARDYLGIYDYGYPWKLKDGYRIILERERRNPMGKIYYNTSINEAKKVLSEYLKQDEDEWKAKKQPGGGYSGGDAILEHINGGFAVVSKFSGRKAGGYYYHIVFFMPDGFITTAGMEYA